MEAELQKPKEKQPNYEYDAVIVLSAAYKMGKAEYQFPTILSESREKVFGGKMRLIAAAQLLEDNKTPILILTGKNVLGEGQLSNAKAQAEFLQKRFRVPRKALLIAEEGEYTTSGQVKYLKEFLAKHNFQGKRVALLTSAYHLPRAVRMFRSEGLNLPFIPAEKILWSRSLHYRKLIKKLYKSQEMDIRRTFERAGIKALLSGTYESQSEESKN